MATHCATMKYQLGAAEFEAVQGRLRGYGFDVHTDVGQYHDNDHGVTIGWIYDRAVGSLVVAVLQKPFILPCKMILDKLNEVIITTQP